MFKIIKIGLKISFQAFLILCLILLIICLVFSNNLHLQQKLAILPKVKIVKANPDIEYLKPTAYSNGYNTTNPTYAYDNATTPPNDTYSDTTTGTDAYPSIVYHTWQTTSNNYSALVLKINRSSSGHSDDQWGIAYSTDGGSNWTYIDSMSSSNVARGTVQVTLSASQDLSQLQVKLDTEKIKGPDGGHVYIYDIWTEGTYTPVTVSVSVSDGVVSYGTLTAGSSQDTTSSGLNDTQTATNDGDVTENFNIKGQNSASWTLTATAGSEQYVHEFSTNGGSNWTALTTTYQTLATNIGVSGTVNFDLKITVPTSTNDYTQQSVDVTIQAVQSP